MQSEDDPSRDKAQQNDSAGQLNQLVSRHDGERQAPRYRLPECISCGERLSPSPDFSDIDPYIADAMGCRCKACATEVVTGQIPKFASPFQHDTGGGRRVLHSTKAFS